MLQIPNRTSESQERMSLMRTVKKPEERKAEMVEAAAKLFTVQGFVKTSVAEIVAAVDVAKGLFYYYFTTKDDMVRAVTEGWAAHCEDVVGRIAGAPLTGPEKLRAIVDCEIWTRLRATPFFEDLCLPQHAALYADAVTRVGPHRAHVVPRGAAGGARGRGRGRLSRGVRARARERVGRACPARRADAGRRGFADRADARAEGSPVIRVYIDFPLQTERPAA